MRPVDLALERFPESAALVRKLYLKDERFRAVCEDLALAVSSLRSFENRKDAHLRPEIADYQRLLKELEGELRSHISSAS